MILHPVGYERGPHILQSYAGVIEPERCRSADQFGGIENEFRNQGHTILTADYSDQLDLLLFDSEFWWPTPGLPETSPYDQRVITSVLSRRVPVAWFDAYDRGPSVEPWRWEHSLDYEVGSTPSSAQAHWYQFARSLIDANHPVLFFMRKMDHGRQYPPWVRPLEYPLLVDYPTESKEEYLARPFDVCGIANMSFPRTLSFVGLLRASNPAFPGSKINADCEIRPCYRRIPVRDFIMRHKAARFFVEADASLGSERPMILGTVAAMLRIISPHKIPVVREDLIHQVVIGDHDGWIRDEDINKLRRVLDDGDLCYSIYVQGADFMRRHYSLEARSQYVVNEISNWLGALGHRAEGLED